MTRLGWMLAQAVVFVGLGLAPAGAQTAPEDISYTLYRSSLVGNAMRIHIATFNATYEDETYNRENCLVAAQLFQQQPGVTVKYWCERGFYKK